MEAGIHVAQELEGHRQFQKAHDDLDGVEPAPLLGSVLSRLGNRANTKNGAANVAEKTKEARMSRS